LIARSAARGREGAIEELLVLRHRTMKVAAGLEDLLLQDLDLPGRVREAAPKQGGLVLEELDLGLELVDLLLVALQLLFGIAIARPFRHHSRLSRGALAPIYAGAGPLPLRGPLSSYGIPRPSGCRT